MFLKLVLLFVFFPAAASSELRLLVLLLLLRRGAAPRGLVLLHPPQMASHVAHLLPENSSLVDTEAARLLRLPSARTLQAGSDPGQRRLLQHRPPASPQSGAAAL